MCYEGKKCTVFYTSCNCNGSSLIVHFALAFGLVLRLSLPLRELWATVVMRPLFTVTLDNFWLSGYNPDFLLPVDTQMDSCCVPVPIKQLVQKQNLEFHHHKSHYNHAYFQFIKELLIINYSHIRAQLELNLPPSSVVRMCVCVCVCVRARACVCV